MVNKIPFRAIVLNYVDHMIKYASYPPQKLLDDREFILQTIKSGRCTTDYFQSDREIMLNLLVNYPHVLMYVDVKLSFNQEFILEVAARNGYIIFYIDKILKYDRTVLSVAAHQLGLPIRDGEDVFKRIALTAIHRRIDGAYYALDFIYEGDPEIKAAAGMDEAVQNRLRNADRKPMIAFLEQGAHTT